MSWKCKMPSNSDASPQTRNMSHSSHINIFPKISAAAVAHISSASWSYRRETISWSRNSVRYDHHLVFVCNTLWRVLQVGLQELSTNCICSSQLPLTHGQARRHDPYKTLRKERLNSLWENGCSNCWSEEETECGEM